MSLDYLIHPIVTVTHSAKVYTADNTWKNTTADFHKRLDPIIFNELKAFDTFQVIDLCNEITVPLEFLVDNSYQLDMTKVHNTIDDLKKELDIIEKQPDMSTVVYDLYELLKDPNSSKEQVLNSLKESIDLSEDLKIDRIQNIHDKIYSLSYLEKLYDMVKNKLCYDYGSADYRDITDAVLLVEINN